MSDFTLKFPFALEYAVTTGIMQTIMRTHPKFFEFTTRKGEKDMDSGSSGLSEIPISQVQRSRIRKNERSEIVPIAIRHARSVVFSAMN